MEQLPEEQVHFFRLRTGDDVVAKIEEESEDTVTLKEPMIVETETIMEEGRQILFMKEYLPQALVLDKSVTLSKDDIMFVKVINPEFLEQYDVACDFFYATKPVVTKKAKRKSVEEEGNVVSLFEAMLEKKDKPTH